MGIEVVCQNKKAYHDYFIEETFEAGIMLMGTEVKSLRLGKANLKDSNRTVGDYGAQIDFRFTALSRLNMTFSLGYALGFEKDGERREEFMYSLKIL